MIDMQSECHGSKLMKGYQKLRDDEHLFDYTIYVENESISVHKTLLAASSDYFHAMLTGSMKESREDSVTLRGLTAIGVQAIINFAYTGLLEITSDNIDDILLAASHLQVKLFFKTSIFFNSFFISFYREQQVVKLLVLQISN